MFYRFYMQGHIWRAGYENKELQGIVYEDVPEALKKWHVNGTKVIFANSIGNFSMLSILRSAMQEDKDVKLINTYSL